MASISFYFDEMMPHAVAQQLVARGYEVLMAVEVGMTNKDDMTEHLVYATNHQCMLVTQDKPFAGRALSQTGHAGVLCWTGKQDDIGGMVRRLTEFAEQHAAEEVVGQVFWVK